MLQMDRYTWMYNIKRATPEYMEKLSEFMKAAEDDRVMSGKDEIFCPCKKCRNGVLYVRAKDVRNHLIRDGFTRGYTVWDFHGEERVANNTSVSECNNNDLPINNDRHNLTDMLHDLDGNVAQKEHAKFEKLFVAAEKALFSGCTKLTVLSAVIKLYKLKASSGWSDISFTNLLEFLHQEMLPEDNELPISTYQAKKLMCPMDLEIERIDACPNDCMLYRGDDNDLQVCKVCKTSRYVQIKQKGPNGDVTKNGPPAKLLWYFPIIPRLERLYADAKEAKLLHWHAEERKKDGKIRHVAILFNGEISITHLKILEGVLDMYG